MLDADPIRLAQIVSILLNNAAHYSTPGGRIHLSAECAAPELRLSVKVCGVGIRPEDLDKIFEPFVQSGPPSARRQGGLGVGLSLVRTMVVLHGGRVEARSAGPGGRNEFSVRLPALVERAQGEPLSRAEQAVHPEGAGGVTHHVDTSSHREVLIGPGICAPHTTNVSIPKSTPTASA